MRILFAALLVLTSAAQAAPAEPAPAALARAMKPAPVVLLGEVHDNPAVHRLRIEALRLRIKEGWRPALVMEHFDRERQPDIDRARRERPGDADYLIAEAGSPRWPWPMLRPIIVLALENELPILAGNVSRADASLAMRDGPGAVLDASVLHAAGLAAAAHPSLPAEVMEGQQAAISAGHCGHAPAAMLPGLAEAQVARDLQMAALVRAHAARGVLLLAGNGHVRRDIGVARWLSDVRDVLSVGLTEGAPDANEFDIHFTLPGVERADPCAVFKQPAAGA